MSYHKIYRDKAFELFKELYDVKIVNGYWTWLFQITYMPPLYISHPLTQSITLKINLDWIRKSYIRLHNEVMLKRKKELKYVSGYMHIRKEWFN